MPVDLAADAPVFFGDFAETVVYRPKTGATRSIQAVVDRDPPAFLAEAAGFLVNGCHVIVRNSVTAGMAASELLVGGDRLDVADRPGGTLITRTVTRIVQQDAGVLRLEIR